MPEVARAPNSAVLSADSATRRSRALAIPLEHVLGTSSAPVDEGALVRPGQRSGHEPSLGSGPRRDR